MDTYVHVHILILIGYAVRSLVHRMQRMFRNQRKLIDGLEHDIVQEVAKQFSISKSK